MNAPDTNDPMFAAILAAMCDVLASCLAETRSLVESLESKGLLSAAEHIQAMKELPPDQISALAEALTVQLKKRVADHYRELSGGGMIQ